MSKRRSEKKEKGYGLGLQNKVAVITGGSGGIGLAIAEGLAEGVHLLLCARQAERVQEKASEIRQKYGVQVIGVPVDVNRDEDNEKVVQAVEQEFGGADILINNAGTGSNEKIMTAPDEKWQYYWELHVMAAVRLSRGLIPFMRQRGWGVILNNTSICAKQPLDYEPIYNVTKAALMMFSKVLSDEVVGDNIRVNCINPGLVLTPDWRKTATQLTAGTGSTRTNTLTALPGNSPPLGASPRLRNWRTSSSFCVLIAPATALERLSTLMVVGCEW
jgi:NAD(P)-dependent dehydrogenase (short-subunit alcohol dehydrogenase family)